MENGDFTARAWGDEQTSPRRWRLARGLVEWRVMAALSPLEKTLEAEFADLWAKSRAQAKRAATRPGVEAAPEFVVAAGGDGRRRERGGFEPRAAGAIVAQRTTGDAGSSRRLRTAIERRRVAGFDAGGHS